MTIPAVNVTSVPKEPEQKKTKVKSKQYSCTPILDVNTRMECLISKMSLDEIEKSGEFPDIKNIVDKVKVLKFDELKDGPIELPIETRCKLSFLESQKIVLIKAPPKVVKEDDEIKQIRPLQDIEGGQRKLKPIIGVSQNGSLLNLIQLSSKIDSTSCLTVDDRKKSIEFEEALYSRFPSDHDTTPVPITLCLLRENDNGLPSQSRKMKLIQRRESMDLFSLLNKKIPLDFLDALKIARDLLKGLSMCHESFKIVVADIKCENVLINLGDKSGRLTDFGLSYLADKATLATAFVGTPETMAPELLLDCVACRMAHMKIENVPLPDSVKSFARDVWSLGVVLSQLLFRTRPHCCYNLDKEEDDALFSSFFLPLLKGTPDESTCHLFFNRFTQPTFSQSQINTIFSINDAHKEKRINAMNLIASMVRADHTQRPTAKDLWNQFEALINY